MQGNGGLPTNDVARVLALVERSAPDPVRPRLPDEWETQLAEVDAKSAACYASMEDLGDQLAQLAREISLGDGVVVEKAPAEDSLGVHLEDVKGKLPLKASSMPEVVFAAAGTGDGTIKR